MTYKMFIQNELVTRCSRKLSGISGGIGQLRRETFLKGSESNNWEVVLKPTTTNYKFSENSQNGVVDLGILKENINKQKVVADRGSD